MKKALAAFKRNILMSGIKPDVESYEKFDLVTRVQFMNISFILGFVLSCAMVMSALIRREPLHLVCSAGFAFLLAGGGLLLRRTRNPLLAGSWLLSLCLLTLFLSVTVGRLVIPILLLGFSFPVLVSYLCSTKGYVVWSILLLFTVSASLSLDLLGVHHPVIEPRLLGAVAFNLALISCLILLMKERNLRAVRIMRNQIYLDGLTGLPNRKKLLDDINDAGFPCLFLVNIDDFREINDIFGYRIGDSVLVFLARILRNIVPPWVTGVYKLAGDEYAILVDTGNGEITRPMLVDIASEINEYLQRERYGYAEYRIILHVTIGIADCKDGGRTALFSCADIALKAAKTSRKPFLFFSEAAETRKQYQENLKLLRLIADALDDDRVFPYYMPIVRNHDGVLAGFECLARIADPEGRIIAPDQFIPVAKRSRLYQKLTRTMLKKVFHTLRGNDTFFSINMSVEDFEDPYTLQFIKIVLSENPAARGKVSFEILESEGIVNFERFALFVGEMKKLGCHIALDDFGSGYSNFESLVSLNLDLLKIDGSLIRKLDTDPNTRILVENIVDFSRKLGIKTVAEYVHSARIYGMVRELGIDYSQGFYFGRPEPALNIPEAGKRCPELARVVGAGKHRLHDKEGTESRPADQG
jgi:diguanylate cyclase (GGDEF)-like protein